MKVRLLNYNYYNNFDNPYDRELECPIVVLCCREENKKFHAIKIPGNKGLFRPHFFVEDTVKNRVILKGLLENEFILEWGEWDYPAIYDENEKVLVVYVKFPYQVRNLRKSFEHTYQADVNYEELFMMMLGLEEGYFECPDQDWIEPEDIKPLPESKQFYVEPRIAYFDIETEFIDKKKGFSLDNQQIISIVLYDNYENKYYRLEWSNYEESWEEKDFKQRNFKHNDIPLFSYEITKHLCSEKELLIEFFKLFKKHYDAIFGFNSHGGNKLKSVKGKSIREWRNGFDLPVVFKRAIMLGLEKEMQSMSPLPPVKDIYKKYSGVYKRGKGEKFEVVIRGITPLDFYIAEPMMQYTMKYRDFAKYGRSLDNYLRYFSNFHKVEHKGLTVAELKKVDLEKELFYNKVDVEGCFFLDKRFGFSRDIFDTVSLSLVKGINLLSATKIHNFVTLKDSKDYCVYDTKNQVWDRDLWQGWTEEKAKEYGTVMRKRNRAGGYNVEVKKGRTEWVVIMDFSGFYPTLAYSSNAGIDTLIQVEEEYDDYYIDKFGKRWDKKDCIITPAAPFRKDKISIERKIWGKLLRIRQIYKDKKKEMFEKYEDPNHEMVKLYESKQYNLKQRLVNNKYGASGNNGYLAKCFAVYNAPPTLAQCCIRALEKEFLTKLGRFAVMGDSDSIGVRLFADNIDDAIKEANKLVPKANKFINMILKRDFNIDENTVDIGWEKIGKDFYAHKKKMYCMEVWAEEGKKLIENKRYVLYKGFELKKSNRSDITELVQKTYLKYARSTSDRGKLLDLITDFIKRIEKSFHYLPWEKICSRINIRKELKEYSTNYISKRAAEMSNEVLGTNYGRGDHGFLGKLDINGNSNLEPVIMFVKEDIRKIKKLGYNLDYTKHKQSFVIDKLNLFLKDFGTDYHTLLRGGRIKSVFVL